MEEVEKMDMVVDVQVVKVSLLLQSKLSLACFLCSIYLQTDISQDLIKKAVVKTKARVGKR